MELTKFEITDSKLEHSNWHFPGLIKTRPLRDLDDDDFLINHKIDRSYDDSTVRFKLLVGGAVSANLEDSNNLPLQPETLKIVKEQKWISEEYEHLWRRDGGGSAALTSHGILSHVQRLSREMTSTEKRLAEGDLNLENNGDYRLLNRLNLEHIRLQRRSNFELELAANLVRYIDEYYKMWSALWEGGTSYIDDMREKIDQQMRYSEQVQKDLDLLPQRIKNQSKTISNFIIQRDNKLNIQLAESNRRIAEESRRDNLLNLEMAAATAQVAQETRQDSAAMKTIAVLTLTFLPGTAVASFFSMGL
ncbi:hypothetical protein LTR59_015809 [Friedmanniomyces endolithicus]|nr:hypothetical protein LTR94_019249 [Friedmanniomyces endolithicus]KAK0772134.1 hypothetical protein LTR59_015809 [Friedmanniomyces endolithicus]